MGRNLNLFVMRTHAGIVNRNREVRVVINPETIIEAGEDVSTVNEKIEGCLSIPAGVTGWVTRCHEVRCVYWDENGHRHDESLCTLPFRKIAQSHGYCKCGIGSVSCGAWLVGYADVGFDELEMSGQL
ncbi:MAG: peptide deformylase [Bryobacteraceae bacterium]